MGIVKKLRYSTAQFFLFLLFGGSSVVSAQTIRGQGFNRVTTSASVVETLQLITIRDIVLITPTFEENEIFVSPTESPYAGHFRIFGSNQSTVRVTYLQKETIEEIGGNGGFIEVEYVLSGNSEDNQNQSLLLGSTGEFNIQMNQTGEYFLWVGAVILISQGAAGEYLSEFTIELEYI